LNVKVAGLDVAASNLDSLKRLPIENLIAISGYHFFSNLFTDFESFSFPVLFPFDLLCPTRQS